MKLQGNAIQYITMKWNAMQSNGCHINVTQHSLFTVAGNLVLVAGTLFFQEEFYFYNRNFFPLERNALLWRKFCSSDRHYTLWYAFYSCDRNLGTRVWSLIISFNIHFANPQEPPLPHSVSQLDLSLNAKLSFIFTIPNKLRFQLGSIQAEAVRVLFYKKFKFSWD